MLYHAMYVPTPDQEDQVRCTDAACQDAQTQERNRFADCSIRMEMDQVSRDATSPVLQTTKVCVTKVE